MPSYEYRCKKCKLRFEATNFIRDRHAQDCPKCNENVQLLVTGTDNIFIPYASRAINDADRVPDSMVRESHARAKREGRELQRVKKDDF